MEAFAVTKSHWMSAASRFRQLGLLDWRSCSSAVFNHSVCIHCFLSYILFCCKQYVVSFLILSINHFLFLDYIFTARSYAEYALAWCLSVSPSACLSVRPSATRLKLFLPSGIHTILVFYTKHYGNIPTRPLKRERRMRQRYEKIAIFGQYLALSRKLYKIHP